ncbi:ATP-binding protein [uncultured Lactobacillus sp.]|uniref:ATP-binding protein n=1 Tax=uncultured Lactobacillus sp. TaxID=153152 RepID=UPI0028041FF8|nr:RNA-binding domain-containing protein [uncultured Lactobacillus sp.]
MSYKEDTYTEFKKAKKSVPADMWPTVSAFANTDGGTIKLGYTEIKENNQVKYQPTGVLNPDAMVKDILDTANNPRKLYPNVIKEENVVVKTFDNDIRVIEVYIPKADFRDRPVYIKGDQKNTYKRVGTSDQIANYEDVKAMLRDARGDDSAETLDGYDFSDLNLIDIQNYKTYYAEKNDEPEIAEEDNKQFLKEIGLYRKDRKDQKFKITRALLLLFGKYNSIQDEYPDFMLDLVVKHTPSEEDYVDRLYTSFRDGTPDNIYSFFVHAYAKLQALVNNSFELKGVARKDNGTIFLRAIREALVNSLVHADYHSNQSIQIIWYDNSVVFKNPGQLLVSIDKFFDKTDSVPRNSLIFQTFVEAKLGEHTGSGGYRILRTSQNLKLRIPDMTTSPQQTELIIWRDTAAELINSLPEDWQSTYKILNTKMVATFEDLQHLYSSSWKGHKILRAMIDKGLIVKTGKGRATKYLLSPDSPQARSVMNQFYDEMRRSIFKN